MLFDFKQAAKFGSKSFAKGIHQVDDVVVLNHHYFKHLLKYGLIMEVKSAPIAPPASSQDHQRKLAEKMKADAEAKAKVEAEVLPVDEDQSEESAEVSEDSEKANQTPSPKHGHKKNKR